MGLLDGLLGNLAGAASGGNAEGAAQTPLNALLGGLAGGDARGALLSAAVALFQQHGGLPGVLELLRSHGLTQQVESWLGNGPAAAVSAEQIQQVFGSASLHELAGKLGVQDGEAGSLLARFLPDLVRQFGAQGAADGQGGDLLSQGLNLLRRVQG